MQMNYVCISNCILYKAKKPICFFLYRIESLNWHFTEHISNHQFCICFSLEFIKDPIKTRCGHSFCKACIWKVLQTKKTTCPLCQKSLTRRNVSKDDHMQTCIERFTKLVSAIQADTNIDSKYKELFSSIRFD